VLRLTTTTNAHHFIFTFHLFLFERFCVLLFFRLAYRQSLVIPRVVSTLPLLLLLLALVLLFLLLGRTRTRWTHDHWLSGTAACGVARFVVIAERTCVARAASTA